MEEHILRTQEIYNGRVVKLAVHDVQLPNGAEARREVVKHPGAVAIVAMDTARNVLMVRQFRLPAGKILREIPAGTLQDNELPDVCAVRELQEETGFRPGKLEKIGGIYLAPGYSTEYIHLYLATELTPSVLKGDDDEFLEVERLPLTDLLAMIDRGEIADAKSITALLRVARKLGL
jgi:ADP-ribose pyrophosphatase